MNVFRKHPVFVESDIRTTHDYIYAINSDFLDTRYSVFLPLELIKDKTILDIGCCIGAAGAWACEYGAKSYCGIELQSEFANKARENLASCYPNSNWEIIESSFDDFFKNNTKTFDIVIASGVLYTNIEYQKFLANVIDIATTAIVIESSVPAVLKSIIDDKSNKSLDKDRRPVVEYTKSHPHIYENGGLFNNVWAAVPSVGAVEIILAKSGFVLDEQSYQKSNLLFPNFNRYAAIFHRTANIVDNSVEFYYKNKNKAEISLWSKDQTEWSFNNAVADIFVDHARGHIPDYDKVIDLSVDICKRLLKNPLEDRVIDVGCATGETIRRLFDNGIANLVGVDNSQAMLNKCDPEKAYYVCSDSFPVDQYSSIICNWTLHFIKDKLSYLKSMHSNLKQDGFLILTDKIADSGIELDLYHDFKRQQGVSEEEISAKVESLKGVMFIDPIDWYVDTLKSIGFTVTIINSAPCFVTFLAFKTKIS